MKAAAAQAGFDPALVDRAARLLRANATATPSFLERVIGGRRRHCTEAHFPVVLDEAGAARLLSAIRIAIGRAGEAHSGPTGLTWRSADEGGAVLSLTALADREGTSLTVDLDRRATLVVGGSLTLAASFLAFLFGGTLTGEIAPGLELIGALGGAGSVLALARSFWASSTRSARERLGSVMDSTSRFLSQAGHTVPDPAAGPADAAPVEGERAGEAG